MRNKSAASISKWQLCGDEIQSKIKKFPLSERAFLSNLLNEWTQNIRRYSQFCMGKASGATDDLPFRYGERTTAGIIASAAWQAGGIALTEYASTKADKNDRRKNRVGRGDLHFSSTSHAYQAEIKSSPVNFSGKVKLIKSIVEKTVDAAQNDTRHLPKNLWYGRRTAIAVFEVVNDRPIELKRAEAIVIELQQLLHSRSDFMAWCFLEQAALFELYNGEYCSGAFMCGKFIDH